MPFLDGLTLYIPTFQRAGKQHTWRNLTDRLRQQTHLVCPADEVAWHTDYGIPRTNILVQPPEITTIAAKRAWIVAQCPTRYVVMLDDDLEFHARADGSLTKGAATPARIDAAFLALRMLLSQFAHAGIGPRQGNNHVEGNIKQTTRLMFAFGYDRERVGHLLTHDPEIALREDFHWTLKLLSAGYDNALISRLVVSPAKFGQPGGCSAERTIEASNAQADALAARWPGVVRVTEKAYSSSIPRKEVMVQWQKCLRMAVQQESPEARIAGVGAAEMVMNAAWGTDA